MTASDQNLVSLERISYIVCFVTLKTKYSFKHIKEVEHN